MDRLADGGRIINISSAAATKPVTAAPVYSMAKVAIKTLTHTLAIELGPRGITANAVAPGFVASSGLDQYDPKFSSEVIPQMNGYIPLKRLCEEAEISSAIVFLLCDAAAFITGVTIKIDGGASLNTKLFPLQGKANNKPFNGFHRAVRPKVLDRLKD